MSENLLSGLDLPVLPLLKEFTRFRLRCIGVLLKKHRFHFRTSQKRFLVKLLESYQEKDLRANLVLSGKGAERNILLLNYLDYSVYSRSAGHMAAVNDLRDGKLRSWESIDRLRFFVYWNDKVRVDVDLHAGYTDLFGSRHSVGWNANFKDRGVVFSGDITHSDAAEYIDVDLNARIDKVNANIHLYAGRPDFSKIETCYVGMMAVPEGNANGRESALYSEGNCFFRHNLQQTCETVNYGYIDVQHRCLVFDGTPQDRDRWYEGTEHRRGKPSS